MLVVGGEWFTPRITSAMVLTTTPAGAPPGWPAFCSQSRNAASVVVRTDPPNDMHVLKSESEGLQTSWNTIGTHPPMVLLAAAVTNAWRSVSVFSAEPSTSIARTANAFAGGIVSAYGSPGTVTEFESPPAARPSRKQDATMLLAVASFAP